MAASNGCEEPQYPIPRWPLKIGNAVAAIRAVNEGHLLKHMYTKLEDLGVTRVERLFWFRVITTVDPANIEAILSSQFKGWPSHVVTVRTKSQTDATPRRLRAEYNQTAFLAAVRNRNFHSRRASLEAFSGDAQTSIRKGTLAGYLSIEPPC